eukprot:COSAG01_NODE_40981_length_457_cov_0.857542_1_plen_81_part_10
MQCEPVFSAGGGAQLGAVTRVRYSRPLLARTPSTEPCAKHGASVLQAWMRAVRGLRYVVCCHAWYNIIRYVNAFRYDYVRL